MKGYDIRGYSADLSRRIIGGLLRNERYEYSFEYFSLLFLLILSSFFFYPFPYFEDTTPRRHAQSSLYENTRTREWNFSRTAIVSACPLLFVPHYALQFLVCKPTLLKYHFRSMIHEKNIHRFSPTAN